MNKNTSRHRLMKSETQKVEKFDNEQNKETKAIHLFVMCFIYLMITHIFSFIYKITKTSHIFNLHYLTILLNRILVVDNLQQIHSNR